MPSGTRTPASQATAFAVAWLVYFTALQWSVVRYRIPIVAALTLSTLALAWWQWRGRELVLGRAPVVAMLTGSALATLAVPLFSYLATTGLAVATTVLVVAPLAAALLLGARTGRASRVAGAVAVTGYAAGAATAIISSPRPRIDVWVTLQQASDGLARGQDFYAMTWRGSPGIQDAFTYLPWTAVLLAPGRWLAGDVRWALLVATLVAVVATAAVGRWSPLALGSATLLALAPGSVTQAEQAWTEPLLLACLAVWALLVRRGHAWWAVVPLALGCASKQ